MRYYPASRRPFRPKATLALGIFALFFGLQASFALAKPGNVTSWEYLQPDRDQVIASLNVVELLKRHHYNKPPLNDARSAKIFDSYIEMLDPSRSYFTAGDLAKFEASRSDFDNYLKNGNLEPGFAIYRLHLERFQGRLQYALSLLKKGVDHFGI